MNIESILGITASLIAIGSLIVAIYRKCRRKDLSTLFTELADKNTTVKRQRQILRSIRRNLMLSGHSISKDYINKFVANGMAKSRIFHEICIHNNIEPTMELCNRVLGFDEPTFRKEWHSQNK